MACVIADPCVGCLDAACVEACPVDCIEGPVTPAELARIPKPERGARLPGVQLYIDADQCICCSACLPACPAGAIFDEGDLPAPYAAARERNAAYFKR